MITVQVKGLAELEKKMGWDFIYGPVVTNVRNKLSTRVNRRRKRQGYINNPLAVQNYAVVAANAPIVKITTSLNPPRNVGSSWLKFIYSLVNGSFFRNQVNAEVRKTLARWK